MRSRAGRPGATFRGWLWTVNRHRILDFFRRQCKQARACGGSSAQEQLVNVPDSLDALPVDEPSREADITQLTRRAMDRVRVEFRPRTWQLFEDSVLQNHATALVAARHGVTPATVRKAKSRILHPLRQELGEV